MSLPKPADPCGSDTSAQFEQWDKIEGKQWSKRLARFIDTRYESDECAFCGRPIDPETAYHNSICRYCV